MIIIINGPLGIGKTQTAWKLLYRFDRAAVLEADYIAAFHPFDFYNQEHLDYAYSLIGTLAGQHVAHGIRHLVLNWVLESPEQLERIKHALASCGLPIQVFRLTCDFDEIERRIRKRNQDDVPFELSRSRELVNILDTAALAGDMGYLIDTTHLSIDEVVDIIWTHVHQ